MSILTRYRKPVPVNEPAVATLAERTAAEEESANNSNNNTNDFDCSIDTLYQGFLVWHRLQREGIVRQTTRDDVFQQFDSWQNRYPENFALLHRGSRCPESFVIGKGKYSTVYQRQNFAFKVIRIGHERQDDHVSVMRCNIKELGYFHSLLHPNVMRCVQSQLVMEHGSLRRILHQMTAARCNLQHIIDAHEITCFQDLVYMFEGIARGLQYLHHMGVVHGDVKPSNVLISQQYRPMLSDFTLTTAEGKGNEIAFGTLYWRSPECLLLRGCQRSSDVWSFGMMLLDCLYGCTYMMNIMNAKDDHDLLIKLSCIVDPPSAEWLQANLEPLNDALPLERREQLRALWQGLVHPDPVWCDHVTEHNQLQISLQPQELEWVQDLISKLLVWEASQRLTMDQVLQHPMFTNVKAVTPFPQVVSPFKTKLGPLKLPTASTSSAVQEHPVFQITWRDPSEREYIRNWTKFFYLEQFHHNLPAEEDWLLSDITVMAKRLIDHLRLIECTFHLKTVIKVCSEFLFFLWKDWPYAQILAQNPLFEAQMFHVLYLLKFQLFPFNVQERYVHQSAAASTSPEEEEAAAEAETEEKTAPEDE